MAILPYQVFEVRPDSPGHMSCAVRLTEWVCSWGTALMPCHILGLEEKRGCQELKCDDWFLCESERGENTETFQRLVFALWEHVHVYAHVIASALPVCVGRRNLSRRFLSWASSCVPQSPFLPTPRQPIPPHIQFTKPASWQRTSLCVSTRSSNTLPWIRLVFTHHPVCVGVSHVTW